MPLNKVLAAAILECSSTQGLELTPHLIASAFEAAALSDATNRIMGSILKQTRKDSSDFHMRSKISPAAVRLAYEGAIHAKVQGVEIDDEADAAAHRLLSHIIDDERLFKSVSPEYVHHKFIEQMGAGTNGLRTAAYLFQSTELSPEHRKKFSPQNVEDLFSKLYKNKDWALLGEVFQTTRVASEYSSPISPAPVKHVFRECVKILIANKSTGKSRELDLCKNLLRHTIVDNDYRGENAIDQQDIKALKEYLKNIVRFKSKSPFDRAVNASIVEMAVNDLEFIEVCTSLPHDNQDRLVKWRDEYSRGKRKDRDPVSARECLKAIEAYPALKNG